MTAACLQTCASCACAFRVSLSSLVGLLYSKLPLYLASILGLGWHGRKSRIDGSLYVLLWFDYHWLESKVLTSELVSAFWLCWSGKKTSKNAWLRRQASPRFAADSTRLKPNHMRIQAKSGSNKLLFMLIFYVKQIWSPDISSDFSYQGCLIKS